MGGRNVEQGRQGSVSEPTPRYVALFPHCQPSEVLASLMQQRLFMSLGRNGVLPVAPITNMLYIASADNGSMVVNFGNRQATTWSYGMRFAPQGNSTVLSTYFVNHDPSTISVDYVDPMILDADVSTLIKLTNGKFLR